MFECPSIQALPRSLSRPVRRRTPTNDANFSGKSSWFPNGRNNNQFFGAWLGVSKLPFFLADRENNAPFLTSAILPIFDDRGNLMSSNAANPVLSIDTSRSGLTHPFIDFNEVGETEVCSRAFQPTPTDVFWSLQMGLIDHGINHRDVI